jgi:ATP-dependent Lhr-like helicase
MLFLRDRARLLAPRLLPVPAEPPEGAEHDRLRELLSQRGACFFRELAGADDVATLDALWDLVWAGEVTNDSFAAVRALSSRRRSGAKARGARPRLGALTVLGPPKAQGRWSLLTRELGDVACVNATEAATALVSVLLDRHGVLTREAARGEGVPGGFAAVYPVLRAMEESGRIRRGYFVTGLGGAQFALPGAVDRLRGFRDGMPEGVAATVVLAATDPANPFGVALPWPQRPKAEAEPTTGETRPQRAAGAFVVLVDGLASLYVERGGKGLVALRALDGTWEAQAVSALVDLVARGRFSRLSVERFPPELEPLLHAAEFVPTPKGLVRYA